MADCITLVLNGSPVTLPPGTSPTMTLLDWLRGPAGLTGTKEGCAEGDCGACTVVLEGADGTRAPINACLAMLGQVHGLAVRTVEGLRGAEGGPHPVQRLLAESDATQCGFCTPGITMSAWAHARQGGPGGSSVHEALAGNLCRCTGYRPIIEAFSRLQDDGAAPPALPAPASAVFEAPGQVFFRPAGLQDLLALRAANPGALLLAGGTDLGLLASEHRQRPPAVIGLLGVPELQALSADAAGLTIGAAVPYARLLPLLDGPLAPLGAMLTRLGSRQIRALGSIGGNLGTASPIGDMLPPLLALGATLRIASLRGERDSGVEDFLLGYRKTTLAPDEVILSIRLPRPPEGAVLACEKVSKRHDQDISAVSGAFLVRVEAGRIAEARLAFGGMGPMAARARAAEAMLTRALMAPASFADAADELAKDFAPLSDWRGSAAYRLAAAQGLLRRLYWRVARPDLPAEVHAL
ncbi:xanthine dehydrogenase small subunit [Paracraurococcus lichenis]|uniref:FAD binding domain-containing protein n=1 Tax=Paracraurococcus lichenis TaxID=3064888 RepID=A0ABT9E2E3_9PROT|nr:FAD binding domain-containing protein [Paracraurococcus sp. LOR1-02]MDO9710336.1 FAD binding domain-containing protein [Paracraurococcus sp. LOR1-02]